MTITTVGWNQKLGTMSAEKVLFMAITEQKKTEKGGRRRGYKGAAKKNLVLLLRAIWG